MEASAIEAITGPVSVRSPLQKAEMWVMVVVSALMVALPLASALWRLVTGSSLTGAIVFVQHLTLWAGFVGALIAAGLRAHLHLATAEFLPEGRPRDMARFFAMTVAGAVTALLAYAGVVMINADRLNDVKIFQLVPEWWSELIMPLALGLMALRYALLASEKRPLKLLSLGLVASAFALNLLTDQAAVLKWPGAIFVLAAVLLGAPVYVGMAGIAMVFFFGDGTPIATIPIEIFRLVESPTLPAVPLLTLCGFVLAEGGASARLVRAARSIVGFMPGGLAVMVTIVCALFTTLTGGSGVTIIALGGLMLPIMLKEGYPEGFALGLVTAAGSLGLLFPPSLPVILYSVVAGTGADRLFLGGLVPGVLLIAVVVAYCIWTGRRLAIPRHPFRLAEARAALWDAKWELAIPILLLLGIFGGKTTIVEASAVAAGMAFLAECVIFRDLDWKRQLPDVIRRSGSLMGAVLIVLGAAMGLTSYLVDAQIPDRLLSFVTEHVHSRVMFLLAMNLVLLVLGSVLEIYSAIVILAPLIVPLGAAFHIDPIHMGVVFLSNLELGFLFPPVGLNLLLSSSRFSKPLPQIYRMTLPFLLIMAAGVLFITYVPQISEDLAKFIQP